MPTDFNPNVPTGAVRLDRDYQNLQKNNQQLDTTYGVDHVAFSVSENNGYHKVVHMIYSGGTPAPASGTGEIYTELVNDGYSNRGQLKFQNSSSQVVSLTRNFSPVITQNGSSYIAGGLVMNWGKISITSSGTAIVTFTPAFPNNIFHVFLTPILSSATTSTSMLYGAYNITTASFEMSVETNTGKLTGFSFLALGN